MQMFKLAPTILEDGTRKAVNPANDPASSYMLFSDQDCCPSEIVTSSLAGTLFPAYVQQESNRALGSAVKNHSLPFVVKLDTLKEDLPVSVHVDPNQLKMLYVLSAGEGACIYYGLNETISREQLYALSENNELLGALQKVAVHAGQVFLFEPGTIYAASGPIRYIEILQKTKPAEFTLQQQLDAAILEPLEADFEYEPLVDDGQAATTVLASCDAFTCFQTDCHGRVSLRTDDLSFGVLIMVSGSAIVAQRDTTLHVETLDSVYIKAGTKDVTVTGNCTYLYIVAA